MCFRSAIGDCQRVSSSKIGRDRETHPSAMRSSCQTRALMPFRQSPDVPSSELRAYKSESSLIEQRIKLDSRAISYGGAVYKDVHCRHSDRDV